ncbi:MAG: hypothetical protein ACYDCC_09755 [Actinomycetota bacterium]
MRRDESGLGEALLAGLIALALVAAGVTYVSVVSIMQGVGPEQRNNQIIVANLRHTFYARIPINSNDQATVDCQTKSETAAGIGWTGNPALGYRRIPEGGTGPVDDEPRISQFASGGTVNEPAFLTADAQWQSTMEGLIAQARNNMKDNHCEEESMQASALPSEAPLEIAGTYNLSFRNPPPFECRDSLPKTLTVSPPSGNGQAVKVTVPGNFAGRSGSVSFDASYAPYQINGALTLSDGPGLSAHYTVSATFLLQDQKTIVEGTWTDDVGGGCSLSFQGTK